jgi:hypothetical protein
MLAQFYSRVWFIAKRENIGLPLPTAIEIKNEDIQPPKATEAIAEHLAASEVTTLIHSIPALAAEFSIVWAQRARLIRRSH